MKKRLLSLFLVLAMVCAMSVSASAIVEEVGYSSNGTSGDARCVAKLILSLYQAEALSSSGAVDASKFRTTVSFTYTDEMDQEATMSDSGYSVALVEPDDMKAVQSYVHALSHHRLLGGIEWGSWSCTLSDSR